MATPGRSTIHVALIGEQTMPIYMAQRKLEARVFVPVASSTTRQVADRLGRVFQQEGVDIREPVLVSPYVFPEIVRALERTLKDLQQEGEVVVNLTGGTKLMALAAHIVALSHGCTCCYVSTETEEFLFLKGDQFESQSLRVNVDLQKYLGLHDLEVVQSAQPAEEERNLSKLLGGQAPQIARLLEAVHDFSRGDRAPVKLTSPTPQERHVVRELERRGILSVQETREDLSLSLLEKSWQTFLSGGWLEVYTFASLEESGAWDGVACRLKVRRVGTLMRGQEVDNELDVVTIRNGRLCLFSCKSGRNLLTRTKDAREPLNELAAVSRREGLGIYCECFLVTTSPYAAPKVQQSARARNIHLITLDDLPRLAGVVQEHLCRKVRLS